MYVLVVLCVCACVCVFYTSLLYCTVVFYVLLLSYYCTTVVVLVGKSRRRHTPDLLGVVRVFFSFEVKRSLLENQARRSVPPDGCLCC